MTRLGCPYCGWKYDPTDKRFGGQTPAELVPPHDFPPPCRSVCPGTRQKPREAGDRRPLWKDLKEFDL